MTSWEKDGPDRHKRQRISKDPAEFWQNVESSDWIINQQQPSFIQEANRSGRDTKSRYGLRRTVRCPQSRFTQTEECGYEEDFGEQIKDNNDTYEYECKSPDSNTSDGDDDDDDDEYPESEGDSINEYHVNGQSGDEDDDDALSLVSLVSENDSDESEGSEDSGFLDDLIPLYDEICEKDDDETGGSLTTVFENETR